MTRKEVKEYLYNYCGLKFKEEDCTLENVLGLIPNADGSGFMQKVLFAYTVPLSEHCTDELDKERLLKGDLKITRDDDGMWMFDWDWYGITGVLPQSEDLMEAALYMCEFCEYNGISLFNPQMDIEL